MPTVRRMSSMCDVGGMHEEGNRGCAGSCVGNDRAGALGNAAGDHIRVICTCPCHSGAPRSTWPKKLTAIAKASIEYEAKMRHNAHDGQASSRPFSENYQLLGIAGEVAFSRDFDLERKKEILPRGDGRFDFRVGRLTIDPKVARNPKYLFREVDKQYSAILVQGGFQEDGDSCYIIWEGWEFSELMLEEPTKDFGHGVVNHYKRVSDLRDMLSLRELLAKELHRSSVELNPSQRESQR